MKILTDIQGSPGWFKSRCGVPSASGADKIITTKGEPSKQRTKYLYQLAAERITGQKTDTYHSKKMDDALIMEEEARDVFSMENKVIVEQAGFCLSDCGRWGFSPDGLMPDAKTGWECKCPESHTHVEYLLKGELPTAYFQQVQGSLFTSGYDKWIFYSYFPGLPSLQVDVYPDIQFHKALEVELVRFCNDLDRLTEKLRAV